MPGGNACSGHSSGPVLWCMQGVQLDHFVGSSYLKSNLISLPYAILCVMQGVGPSHFIHPGFGQSRHALRQSMWLVWLQASFETNWEFTRLMQKEARGTSEAKQTRGKTLEQQDASREHL